MVLGKNKNNKILNRRGIAGQQIDRGVSGQKKFSRFVFSLLFLFFIAISIYVVFFSGFLQINQVTVIGTEDLNSNRISEFVMNSFSGKILNLVSKNNYILISGNKIGAEISDQFKKISRAEVKKIFPNVISINIMERKSILLWCSAGPCYFIDEEGVAYEWADLDSEEIESKNMVKLSDVSEKPVQVGEKILDKQSVEFISSLKEELKNNLDIEINNEFQTSSRIAQDFQVQTFDGTKIFFSLTESLKEEMGKLKVFFEKEFRKEDIQKLEYIDLRSENRVYYKLKDEERKEEENAENAESQNAEPVKEEKKDEKKKD